jgi:serine protease Do
MRGQMIGIIDNSYNTAEARNIVSAIGISELKQLIATMCNDKEKPFIGILGMDVPTEVHENLGVPKGAYITTVQLDTPAMEAGIQSGDIIVKVDDLEIGSFYSFVLALFNYQPDQPILLTVLRQGPDDYLEFEFEVVPGSSE